MTLITARTSEILAFKKAASPVRFAGALAETRTSVPAFIRTLMMTRATIFESSWDRAQPI